MSTLIGTVKKLFGRTEEETVTAEEFIAPIDNLLALNAIETAVLYERYDDAETLIGQHVDACVARYRRTDARTAGGAL